MDNPLIPTVKYATLITEGDGVKTAWEFNFAGGYLSPEHVKAFTENTVTGELVIRPLVLVGPNTAQITPAVADGLRLIIYRDTPKTEPLVDYSTGSILNESSLDKSNKQAVFISAELADRVVADYDFSNALLYAVETATAASNTANAIDGKAQLALDNSVLAVERVAKVYDYFIDSARFGTKADYNVTTQVGTDNTAAIVDACNYMRAIGGGTLVIPPGDYYMGESTTSRVVALIEDLSNCHISAYGARFFHKTLVSGATPFLFTFKNPNNVKVSGARSFDTGFDTSAWQTHERWGMGMFNITATRKCDGFEVVDCEAENVTYFVVCDQRASGLRNLMSGISVSGRVVNAYYGVDLLYSGENVRVVLDCIDVRRGFISYGSKNADVDINLRTSSGFSGSNAFISIACEGRGAGLGADGDVDNLRIKLRVSGYEAHSAYVHFYQQAADSAGAISNVECSVQLSNLSAVGKNPGIAATNVYLFDHELPNGTILASTSREFNNIDLTAGITGTITGSPILVNSMNYTKRHTIGMSQSLARLKDTYSNSPMSTAVNWLSPWERPLPPLIPVGTTTAGAPVGLTTSGTFTTVGSRVFFSAQIGWTGHSGTGNLRIAGLPYPVSTDAGVASVQVLTAHGEGLAVPAGSRLMAFAGGAANLEIVLLADTAGVLATIPMDSTVVGLYISGSYLAKI